MCKQISHEFSCGHKNFGGIDECYCAKRIGKLCEATRTINQYQGSGTLCRNCRYAEKIKEEERQKKESKKQNKKQTECILM